MKRQSLAFLIGPLFLMACGEASSEDSSVNSRQKKFVVVCDGAVFNDADPIDKEKK